MAPDDSSASRFPFGRFGLVVARYHESITNKLLDGALSTLTSAGVDRQHIVIHKVPGAWELPLAAKWLLEGDEFDAIICLGAVIRGETSHAQHINRFVSMSLGQLSLESGIPIAFGVLTCQNLQQAAERSGGSAGNKGCEAAEAALTMIRLKRSIDSSTLNRSS